MLYGQTFENFGVPRKIAYQFLFVFLASSVDLLESFAEYA